MLANSGHHSTLDHDGLDSIHNYYERRVIDAIVALSKRAGEGDLEFIADVACVALNRLPPRYIRFDVDMTFFTSPQELEEINDKVVRTVNDAIIYVTEREQNPALKFTSAPAPKAKSKTTQTASKPESNKSK